MTESWHFSIINHHFFNTQVLFGSYLQLINFEGFITNDPVLEYCITSICLLIIFLQIYVLVQLLWWFLTTWTLLIQSCIAGLELLTSKKIITHVVFLWVHETALRFSVDLRERLIDTKVRVWLLNKSSYISIWFAYAWQLHLTARKRWMLLNFLQLALLSASSIIRMLICFFRLWF